MNKNEKRGIFSGLFWSYGERLSAQIVTLVISIILARLIEPEEYGAIALVMVFITLANVLVTDGFGNALIQKKDVDQTDFSTIFWFSELFAIIIYGILFILSPFIAKYYEMPILCPVMRILGIKIPIASINSIQRAKVSREMDFMKFFFSTLFGTLVSGVVGIVLAYGGYGIWALVFQYLSNSLIETTVLFFTSDWRPRLIFKVNRLKQLVPFGGRILCVSMMTSLYSNIRNLIIGKRYSAADLAYSNKGQSFPSLISVNISSSITSVIFPALSKIQNDKRQVLALSRKVIQIGSFLMAPLLLGLAAVGNQFVSVVLTEKWLPSVPYMQIMCVVYLLQPIQQASIQAMKALGESKLYLRLEILKKVLGLIILIIAVVCWGSVWDIIFSALIAEIISTVINFPANRKLLRYTYKDQILDMGLPLAGACIMWMFIAFFSKVLYIYISSESLILFINIIGGALIYLGYAKIIKLDSLEYLKGVLIRIVKKGEI